VTGRAEWQPDPATGFGTGQPTAKGSARRSDIVVAAIAVFAERGYEGASLREIARQAGISKGNLTYYFAVKDDLLFEVVADLHDSFLRLAATWPEPGADPRQALRSAFRGHVLLVCERLDATRISYEDFRYLSPDRRAVIVDKRDRYEAVLSALIASCQPAADASPSWLPVATRTVLGALNWPYQWYSRDGQLSPAELAELVADMALRSIRA
jgi:AcrR family transcriptional regulator